MLGTTVNAAAIILGGLMGLILKEKFNKQLQEIVTQASGLAVFLLGLNTALTAMQSPDTSPLLYVVSLMIGGIFGQLVDIEDKLDKFGKKLEEKFELFQNNLEEKISSLIDDKLDGMDEVVVELIRCKTENESLKFKMNELEKLNYSLKNQLSSYKNIGFNLYVKKEL